MTTTTHATMREAADAAKFLRSFIGAEQLEVIGDACRGEEREWFKDKLVQMAALIQAMPKTYEQDGLGKNAVAHLHYFTGGCDWYITEKDIDEDGAGQQQAFGSADMGHGAEPGYISIAEIIEAGAEIDLHFTPKTLAECVKATVQ